MTDVELLPLPDIERYEVVGDIAYPINSDPNGDYVEYDGHVSAMADYARAVAEHNVKKRDAEIEALRAEAIEWRGLFGMAKARADKAETRAERLTEALRPLANLDLRPDGFDKRPDDQTIYARDQTAITVGHVRRAQAALHDHDQEVGNG